MFAKKKLFWFCLPALLLMGYVVFWHQTMQRAASEIARVFTDLNPDFNKDSIQKSSNPFLFEIRVKNPHITFKYLEAKTEGTLFVKLSPLTKKLELSIAKQKTHLGLFGNPLCDLTGSIAYEIHDLDHFAQMLKTVDSIPELYIPKHLRNLFVFNDMSLTLKDLVVFDLNKKEVMRWDYFHLDSKKVEDKFKYAFSTKNLFLDTSSSAALFIPSAAAHLPAGDLERLIYSSHAEGEYTLELPNHEGILSANIYTKVAESELEDFKTLNSSKAALTIDAAGKLDIKWDVDYQKKCKRFTKEKMLKMFKTRLSLENQDLAFATVLKHSDHFQKCFEILLGPLQDYCDNGRDSLSIKYSCSNIHEPLAAHTDYSLGVDSSTMRHGKRVLSLIGTTSWTGQFNDCVYNYELGFDHFNDSLKAIIDYIPIGLSGLMSTQYTTLLPAVPFKDAIYNKAYLALTPFAKEIKGDSVIFSITGRNKEIERIGTIEPDKLSGLMTQGLSLLTPEIEEYSRNLQTTYQGYTKI